MAINKVDLTVSQLLNDLSEGLTWLKKDDLGYGSIETKYGANEKQILAIRKHPKLKDADTSLTVFNIIDDTTTQESEPSRTNTDDQQPTLNMVSTQERVDKFESVSNAVDIFAQL
jgi:hypothetical protein